MARRRRRSRRDRALHWRVAVNAGEGDDTGRGLSSNGNAQPLRLLRRDIADRLCLDRWDDLVYSLPTVCRDAAKSDGTVSPPTAHHPCMLLTNKATKQADWVRTWVTAC